jgi:LysM repeat protein
MQTDHSLLLQDNDTIASVSELVGVNATDLETWNPELNNGSLPGTGSAICILFPMGNYTLVPVAPPINAYPNATAACAQYYTVQSGDGCSSIAAAFGLTSNQFSDLNPGLKTDCTNLILGEAYCVFPTYPVSDIDTGTGIPPNVANGTITNGCSEYYTVVSGDSCGPIETKFNLTSTQFLTYNPEIATDCSDLRLGLAYCVKSNVTTGGGSTGPPTNLASGSLSNCTEYHTVVSGDNCPSIETTYSIAAADFFRW